MAHGPWPKAFSTVDITKSYTNNTDIVMQLQSISSMFPGAACVERIREPGNEAKWYWLLGIICL